MKEIRFRKPEFQKKLARARKYERQIPSSRFKRLAALVLLAVIFYFMVVSSLFLVEDPVLAGNGDSEAIREVLDKMSKDRIYLIPSNHILLINKKGFLISLQRDLPEISKIVSFKRIFPDKLEIRLEEREPRFIWQSGQNFYFLDQEGVVFRKLNNYNPISYSQTLIEDRLAEEVIVGQELGVNKPLNFVEEIKNLWPQKISQVPIASFSIPAIKSRDVFVKTGLGFGVYFDTERRADIQIENLNLLLTQEINPETYSGLSYIDLRLPQVAYYCYQDAPCAIESELRIKN